MWIRGSVGAGKTALLQTTAEMIERTSRTQVIGCHFFARTSEKGHRSEAGRWVPGLVHQMTLALPETLPLVREIIRNRGDDGLFAQRIDGLLDDLLVQPLNSIFEEPQYLSLGWWRATVSNMLGSQ